MQQLVRNIFFVKFKAISEVIILIENRKEARVCKGKKKNCNPISTVLFTVNKQRQDRGEISFAKNPLYK